MASGCCTGPPPYVAWRAGTTSLCRSARVDYIYPHSQGLRIWLQGSVASSLQQRARATFRGPILSRWLGVWSRLWSDCCTDPPAYVAWRAGKTSRRHSRLHTPSQGLRIWVQYTREKWRALMCKSIEFGRCFCRKPSREFLRRFLQLIQKVHEQKVLHGVWKALSSRARSKKWRKVHLTLSGICRGCRKD
jgi:hypothetical protein